VSRWTQFVDYLREGVWHIWIGFDHILFLLSLLLPAVLAWDAAAARWQPVPHRARGRGGTCCASSPRSRGALDHAVAGHSGPWSCRRDWWNR
jgi:hypothetical protein